jgi:hypothetical protein
MGSPERRSGTSNERPRLAKALAGLGCNDLDKISPIMVISSTTIGPPSGLSAARRAFNA